MNITPNKILVIGRRKPVNGDHFGGVVTAFETFLDYLDEVSVPFEVIDVNHQNYLFRVWFVVRSWVVISWRILIGDSPAISLQGTNRDLVWFAPLVIFTARMSRKRITVRKIGGDFDQYYKTLRFPEKNLVDYVLKHSDILFFETRFLVDEFSNLEHVEWFPNIRKSSPQPVVRSDFQRRFVFLSRVEKSKGIDEILEAVELLPDNFTVDIYGPDFGYKPGLSCESLFLERYRGSVSPESVSDILDTYDVLILPTRYPGEGYPGIILEAYVRGLPVITTRWRAIPEIVKDGETGFLINPGSGDELAQAMRRVTEENYPILSANASLFAKTFDSDNFMPRLINLMQGAADVT